MNRLLVAATAAALTIAAAPPPSTPAAPIAPATPPTPAPLDCAKGFERLVVLAKGDPNATSVQAPTGSTMQAISVQTGGVLTVYNFTNPNHAAHPFITRRRMVQADGKVSVEMSTCPYGDKAQSAMLEAQFKRMNDAFVRQVTGAAAPTPPASPTK